VIVCKFAGLPDPRKEGSKNPGATNVLRLGGKKLAALTLFGDVLKGVIAVAIAVYIDPNPLVVGPVMVAVFLGHLYPIFFGFQGGKGVATAFGAIATLSWFIGVIMLATWLLMVFLFRFSSLAALITAVLLPIYIYLFADPEYLFPTLLMSALLIWRHRSNIKRLLNGTEPKMGKKTMPLKD